GAGADPAAQSGSRAKCPRVDALRSRRDCEVAEGLRSEDFYHPGHQSIYAAILELFERGEPADLITVTDRLQQLGKLDAMGGTPCLASLPNTVPTALNAEHYAAIVLEKATLRALIAAGGAI